jgi:hypothetical protein
MSVEFDTHIPGYWVSARFSTLEEAREVAKGMIRSSGTESVAVQTMREHQEPDGRIYWMLDRIEHWAPRLDAIDTSDTRRMLNGQVVFGKYLIGDAFVCFTISAEERARQRERFPEDAEWLDNPPWNECSPAG